MVLSIGAASLSFLRILTLNAIDLNAKISKLLLDKYSTSILKP